MPPRELPAETLDADTRGDRVRSDASPGSDAEADELARAEARAKAARDRANLLRRQADATSGGTGAAEKVDAPAARRRWLRRPSPRALGAAVAILVSLSALSASGYLVWHHREVAKQRQRTAEFTAAARNAVVAMISIDADKAREDIQRFADDTTGTFKVGVLMGGEDLVKAVEQSKSSSKGTVEAAAVQSMTQDSAVVLIAAKSEITKPGQAQPESRRLRIVVTVERDNGELKVSRVDFVP